MERHAPDAMATAVTATWVIAEVTAAWAEEEPATAEEAIALAELKTELSDDATVNLGTNRWIMHLNLVELLLRRLKLDDLKRRYGFLRKNKLVLFPNIAEDGHECIPPPPKVVVESEHEKESRKEFSQKSNEKNLKLTQQFTYS